MWLYHCTNDTISINCEGRGVYWGNKYTTLVEPRWVAERSLGTPKWLLSVAPRKVWGPEQVDCSDVGGLRWVIRFCSPSRPSPSCKGSFSPVVSKGPCLRHCHLPPVRRPPAPSPTGLRLRRRGAHTVERPLLVTSLCLVWGVSTRIPFPRRGRAVGGREDADIFGPGLDTARGLLEPRRTPGSRSDEVSGRPLTPPLSKKD